MALVYRSQKQQILKPVHNLGPGSYNLSDNKNKKKNVQQSSVFASSTKRDPFQAKNQIKKESQNGRQLQNQTQKQGQNLSNGNCLSPKLVKKYPDCQHVFNSKVQRFPQQNQLDQIEQNTKQALLMEQFKKILLKDIKNVSKGKLIKTKDKLQKQNQLRGQNYQFFPSIPNWQSSFGYRYDSSSTKWVANENPNIMLKLIESQKQQEKNNSVMGAGYYVTKNKQKSLQYLNKNNEKQKFLTDSMVYPKLKQKYTPANSIQQSQLRLKARIRLLGKSPLKKTEEKLSRTQNFSNSQLMNTNNTDKKQHLIFSQMIKKFGQFIPQQQRISPSNYIEKLKEKKEKVRRQKVLPIGAKRNSEESTLHFLSKSFRFQTIDSELGDSDSILQSNTSKLNQNSSMILKSHNIKQTLLLGEKRFKENYQVDPLGPGAYSSENIMQKNKSSPCLNLKQKRFDSQNKKMELPGPGEYDVRKDILKKENPLGNIYSYYKQKKNEQINKNLRHEDTMESLYQNWGRQMNYIAKLDKISRPYQSQFQEKNKKLVNEDKSLIKVRQQLQKSLKLAGSINQDQKMNRSVKIDMRQKKDSQIYKEKTSKISPKATKHLYEYKPLPDDKKLENLGPGKYETQPQMIKKTFNVTYT